MPPLSVVMLCSHSSVILASHATTSHFSAHKCGVFRCAANTMYTYYAWVLELLVQEHEVAADIQATHLKKQCLAKCRFF